GLLAAASLSLLAVYRARQDLSVEAGQKLVGGVLSMGAAAFLMAGHHEAAAALAGLAIGPLVTLPSLATRLWTRRVPAGVPSPRLVLVDSLPFGAMALAIVAYYRTPTLILGAFGSHSAVARYTIASTLGFGSLAVGNAITTGLLPRL